jgi:hypothetical protein
VDSPAPIPDVSSRVIAAPASPPFDASDALVGWPSRNPSTGAASTSSTTTASAAAHHRRRTTSVPIRRHRRLSGSVDRRCGQSSRRPAVSSSAASNVSAASTLITGISRPVKPTLRRNGTGRAISAARLTATVTPEKNTARPADAIARSTASAGDAPSPRSSRQRVTISSE